MKTVKEYILSLDKVHSIKECISEAIVKHNIKNVNNCKYVDLGLPSGTLWATCNLGADSPQDKGDFYSWASTDKGVHADTNEQFNNDKYLYFKDGSRNDITKYNKIDKLVEIESQDDVATKELGEDWHIPTKEDFQELIDNCDAETFYKEDNRYIVYTSKENGKTLTFPFNGYYATKYSKYNIGYWTSSLYKKSCKEAYCVFFNINYHGLYVNTQWRNCGLGIRPVKSK